MTMLGRHTNWVVNSRGTRDLSSWLSTPYLDQFLLMAENSHRERSPSPASDGQTRSTCKPGDRHGAVRDSRRSPISGLRGEADADPPSG
jgi:hypothetical protein